MPDRRAQLPSVDRLLRDPGLSGLWKQLGPAGARTVIREVLAEARQQDSAPDGAELEARLRAAATARLQPSLVPVINATGVLLHTNLGRAPLSAGAVAAMGVVAGAYSNLEYDLDTGRRARRDRHLESVLAQLTGASASLVVNNNAAAVLLALHTLGIDWRGAAHGYAERPALARRSRGPRDPSPAERGDNQGEVIVSRGELVEIGESFRIHEIIARGGARLVEVGATNRTRIEDYAAAITRRTRLILRVHRSNFEMRGFVAQPALEELARLAHRRRLPLVEDLGSGCLHPLPGVPHEPLVRDSLRAGVDLVTFSGDKLLGGPQAGIVSGRAALVARLRANPLYRALRVDRLTMAALAATLDSYAREAWEELPLYAMAQSEHLEARVRAFAARLPAGIGATVVAGQSVIGGGSTPGVTLPTWLIALPGAWAGHLRRATPAVVARVERGQCRLDLRTVFPSQEADLLRILGNAKPAPAV